MLLFLSRLSELTDRLVRILLVPFALFTILIVFFEVLMRYVFRAPIITSVELARLGFVWSCFFGATVCFKRQKHIQFLFFTENFGRRGKRIVQATVDLLSLGFFLFLMVKGIQMAEAVEPTYFPALGWSQLWLYLPLPLNALFMLIHTIARLGDQLSATVPPREGHKVP